MIKKAIFALLLAVGMSSLARAQTVTPEVYSTAGDFYSNASGSISWTIGEPMSETFSGGGNFITQGEQQPNDSVTSVVENTPVNADVYPNPATDNVTIHFGDFADGVYVIDVCNTLGQKLSSTQFTAYGSARTTISLRDYANGVYFVTVRKVDGSAASTFKINKSA